MMIKKISLLTFAAAISINAAAQYKKASFFTRNSKFYGFKAGLHVFGNGVSATPSMAFIYGKDKSKNRIWHWWDLEITGASKYAYTTKDKNPGGLSATVNGKAGAMLVWRYNWAFYFANNKSEDKKGLPFAKLAVEAVLAGRGIKSETITPNNANPEKNTYGGGANGGLDMGGGYMYKLSEKVSFFGVAGYRWILNEESYPAFFPNPSHPYVNVGIRFSKKEDE
jgi:hypothetical protein